MAKIGYVENGLRRKNRAKAKANPKPVKAKANPKRTALSLARVKSFTAKNGLKLVPRGTKVATANPRKRRKGRRRRNPSTGFSLTRRNGIFGNTKSDVKQVGALLGGMLGGKALGRIVSGFASPYLSQVGLGTYAEIIADAVVALAVVPFVAGKLGGSDAEKFARLGALGNVAVDILEKVAPQVLQFGQGSLVMSGGQPLFTPQAVQQLVNATSATPDEKAKVAGVVQQIQQGSFADGGYGRSMGSVPVAPLYG